MCMSVDLPEPDGPVAATNSPGSMSSDTPRSACTFTSPTVYVLTRSRTEMTGMTELSAATTAAAAREALSAAGKAGESGAALRCRRLTDRAGQHVRDNFCAFLQLTVERLNQLSLLTIADAETYSHALQLVVFVQQDLSEGFYRRQRSKQCVESRRILGDALCRCRPRSATSGLTLTLCLRLRSGTLPASAAS